MKTRIPATIAIFCLAVVTPAFGKKKGKGGGNQPTSEQVAPPKSDDSTATKPAADAATPPSPPTPTGAATAPPTTPPPLTGNLTTLSGTIYEAVALKQVDPDGLVIVHKRGTAKVLLTDLPENVRLRYYDAQKVAAFQAAQAERQAKERAAAAEKQAAEKTKKEQLKSAVRIEGKVFQVVKEGIIVMRSNGSGLTKGRAKPLLGGEDLVFITGHKRQNSVVDGDYIDVDAIRAGMFSYTTTTGAGKRLAQYQITKTVR